MSKMSDKIIVAGGRVGCPGRRLRRRGRRIGTLLLTMPRFPRRVTQMLLKRPIERPSPFNNAAVSYHRCTDKIRPRVKKKKEKKSERVNLQRLS